MDGTGRIETVNHASTRSSTPCSAPSPGRTGVAALLNTSFNEQEPIVETPAQALDCFRRTAMDYLVLGDRLIWKSEQAGALPQSIRAGLKLRARA